MYPPRVISVLSTSSQGSIKLIQKGPYSLSVLSDYVASLFERRCRAILGLYLLKGSCEKVVFGLCYASRQVWVWCHMIQSEFFVQEPMAKNTLSSPPDLGQLSLPGSVMLVW